MKRNTGNIGTAIRLLPALVIGTVGFYFESRWGLLAIVPLVTGLGSVCPLYSILGLNTGSLKSVQ